MNKVYKNHIKKFRELLVNEIGLINTLLNYDKLKKHYISSKNFYPETYTVNFFVNISI